MKAPHRILRPPEDEKLCVLYDPATGHIVHTHRVTTLRGGRKVDEAEMERRTRERAASRGRDVRELPLLHVDRKSYKLGALYQVDVRTKTLVETAQKPIAHRPREPR
jgi:hypothetical protein